MCRGILLGAFCLLCALGGCAPSATIATNKDQNFAREPKKLIVIEALGPELGEYTNSFKSIIFDRIKSCGITAVYIYRPATEISDNDKRNETLLIQKFAPDTILAIEEAGYSRRTVSNNAGVLRSDVSQIKYNLQVFDVLAKKYVWKAQVSLDTHFGLIQTGDAGAELANSVIQKLEQDKIFQSCPAAQAH